MADRDNEKLGPDAIASLEEPTGYRPDLTDLLKERHAQTASRLAAWVLGILACSIFLHYVCVLLLVLLNHRDDVNILEDVFHAWLPVISGLASAAATYYFTKEGK